ncbi:MAG TPA: hypothetical protein VM753_00515 [Anaeromyxobacter sp.]|jgi:hypothetical protein|nr:hypothetical protein [Anaeromyxobacter sp.]
MMIRKAVLGAAVASALGSLLASGVAFAADKGGKTAEKTVKCVGVNDCKGKGSCKSAKNDCKGQNGCKGQGFTEMTEKACLQKGGTVEQPKPM